MNVFFEAGIVKIMYLTLINIIFFLFNTQYFIYHLTTHGSNIEGKSATTDDPQCSCNEQDQLHGKNSRIRYHTKKLI